MSGKYLENMPAVPQNNDISKGFGWKKVDKVLIWTLYV